jgi:hypothetical protein
MIQRLVELYGGAKYLAVWCQTLTELRVRDVLRGLGELRAVRPGLGLVW